MTEVEQFLQHLAVERNLSKHTVGAYRRDLTWAHRELGITDSVGWKGVEQSQILQLVARRSRQGISARTIRRLLSALRSLYRYLIRENLSHLNPAEGVKAPRGDKKLPATLDVDEIARLLSFRANDRLVIRDRAVMELFYSSGLRLSELAQLRLVDLDLASQQVRVMGKGGKERVAPVGRKAVEALSEWLLQRRDRRGADKPWLFLSDRGTRLAQRSIEARLKVRALQAGLSQNVFPHLMRHSFASHLLESSGNLRAVQELLGHADISTTQIYTHLDFQHLAQVYDTAHPRARRNRS